MSHLPIFLLAESLDFLSPEEFGRQYVQSMEERLVGERPGRESCWTEALAVGSKEFVQRTAETLRDRRELELVQAESAGRPFFCASEGEPMDMLRTAFWHPKSGCKGRIWPPKRA